MVYDGEIFHHAGSRNVDLALRRAAATLDEVERVFLTGASGGGFGTWYAFALARARFPDAEVHVIADSVAPLDAGALTPIFAEQWNLPVPSSCADCRTTPAAIFRSIHETEPTARMGLLTYPRNPVLSTYLSMTAEDFAGRLDDAVTALEAEGGRAFIVPGNSHVVLSNPTVVVDGEDLPSWTQQFFDGDEAWSSVGAP